MKILINPTWRCQLQCDYCWVRAMGWHKRKTERLWQRWLWWLRYLPLLSHVEISGGEPFLYPGLLRLLRSLANRGTTWAMTTNLENKEVWQELIDRPVPGGFQINVSSHAGSSPGLLERVQALTKTGYGVFINVLEHLPEPVVPPSVAGINHIPYQNWVDGSAVDGKVRMCSAGRDHLACDPAGRVYRCLVAMQMGQRPIGNITEPLPNLLSDGPAYCDFGCSTCYRDTPEAWQLQMEVL